MERMAIDRRGAIAALALALLAAACAFDGAGAAREHGWWSGRGPVVPHEGFPADCSLCHVGESWHELREDFAFDHGARTGVELAGAHATAQCLRCHNDRGPVGLFAARGCGGCHEDVHYGQLGPGCEDCHQEVTWRPVGQRERHLRTRFPLIGVHASTSCRRCHPAAEVGIFRPAPVECASCHADDLARAKNPDHQLLQWVNRCDRCHVPTVWEQAEVDPLFGK